MATLPPNLVLSYITCLENRAQAIELIRRVRHGYATGNVSRCDDWVYSAWDVDLNVLESKTPTRPLEASAAVTRVRYKILGFLRRYPLHDVSNLTRAVVKDCNDDDLLLISERLTDLRQGRVFEGPRAFMECLSKLTRLQHLEIPTEYARVPHNLF